jgi:hypothetical protein
MVALEPVDEEEEPDLPQPDGREAEVPDFSALIGGVPALAMGAYRELSSHLGMEPDFAGDEFGLSILDMLDSEGMMEDRGGHGLTPWWLVLPSVISCPPFFKFGHLSLSRMNRLFFSATCSSINSDNTSSLRRSFASRAWTLASDFRSFLGACPSNRTAAPSNNCFCQL